MITVKRLVNKKFLFLLLSCNLLFRSRLEAILKLEELPQIQEQSTNSEIDKKSFDEKLYPTSDLPDWITIFVHGTIMPHLSLNNLIKIVQDKVDRSEYAFTTEFIRNDPFFYQNQPIAQLGLHKIEDSDSAAYVFAKIYDLFGSLNTKVPAKTWYYTYGWSGLLSTRFRLKEAQIFYDRLVNELRRFHIQNHYPKIRLVTYSHGGNIALNLSAVQRECVPAHPLVISELIMIGMPVQPTTDYLIRDPMFERIYHFYSLSDHVQRIDFASRRFTKNKSIKLPNPKLTQVKIKLVGATKKNSSSYVKQRTDPGHIELWFFGWAAQYYRKTFPCYPLPFSALLQWLVNSINQSAPIKDSLETNIDLLHNSVDILSYRSNIKRAKCTIPFIDENIFQKAKSFSLKIKPDKMKYSRQLHDKRRKWARLQATYIKRLCKRKPKAIKRGNSSESPSKYRRYPCKLYQFRYISNIKNYPSKKVVQLVADGS